MSQSIESDVNAIPHWVTTIGGQDDYSMAYISQADIRALGGGGEGEETVKKGLQKVCLQCKPEDSDQTYYCEDPISLESLIQAQPQTLVKTKYNGVCYTADNLASEQEKKPNTNTINKFYINPKRTHHDDGHFFRSPHGAPLSTRGTTLTQKEFELLSSNDPQLIVSLLECQGLVSLFYFVFVFWCWIARFFPFIAGLCAFFMYSILYPSLASVLSNMGKSAKLLDRFKFSHAAPASNRARLDKAFSLVSLKFSFSDILCDRSMQYRNRRSDFLFLYY
jgi:hypothetical protein